MTGELDLLVTVVKTSFKNIKYVWLRFTRNHCRDVVLKTGHCHSECGLLLIWIDASVEEQRAKPAISEGAVSSELSLRVVDSYGEWTTLWESQFAALNIPHLRSHALVHTDPFNKVRT